MQSKDRRAWDIAIVVITLFLMGWRLLTQNPNAPVMNWIGYIAFLITGLSCIYDCSSMIRYGEFKPKQIKKLLKDKTFKKECIKITNYLITFYITICLVGITIAVLTNGNHPRIVDTLTIAALGLAIAQKYIAKQLAILIISVTKGKLKNASHNTKTA